MPKPDAAPLRDDELLITREFAAPRALVWRMWAEKQHLIRWWGPEGFTVTHLDYDFRPGGRWRVGMVSERYGRGWSGGVFRTIEPEGLIVFTFAWEEGTGEPIETVVTVRLEEKDGRTLQHFHQAPFSSVASRDSHVAGWNSLFNKEAAYAAGFAAGQGTAKS